MKSKTKIWLGVGAFVVAGVSGANGESPAAPQLHANDVSGIALTRALSTDLSSAKKRQGGEGGEHGEHACQPAGQISLSALQQRRYRQSVQFNKIFANCRRIFEPSMR